MTDAESSVIEKFVLDDGRIVETAIAIHESWPDIKAKICRCFLLETVRGNLSKKMESPHWPEFEISATYGKGVGESGISVHSNSWKRYEGGGRTSICLQAQGKGANDWSICVYSPLLPKDMTRDEDRSRRKQLETDLDRDLNGGNKITDYCPWWMWVDDKYRDWDLHIPAIYQEWQEEKGGEIMRYFVEEFVKIAKVAIPVIDRIEGGDA